VVPTLLGSVDAVREALEHLEVQFLANRDARLHFALLSDFTDAPAPTREGDGAILDAAVRGIQSLNARYPAEVDHGDAFLLFHRPRLWNPTQGAWMGWERKRGKLAQFNRYLRGGARDAFSVVAGDTRTLGDVRTSSRWIPIPCCRAPRRRRSWARWRIPSIGRCTTRRAVG